MEKLTTNHNIGHNSNSCFANSVIFVPPLVFFDINFFYQI